MVKKIGLVGGSFNPPHYSHIKIGELLIENKYVDEVWYIPCYKSLHNKDLIDGIYRYNMLKKLTNQSDYNKNFSVNDIELRNKMEGKSIDLINLLKKIHDFDFYFVVGLDNALLIKEFSDWEKLIKNVPFIVFKRKCDINDENDDGWYKKEPHLYLENLNIPKCSSSDIRKEISNIKTKGLSKNFFKNLSWDIFKYIIENGLYLDEK